MCLSGQAGLDLPKVSSSAVIQAATAAAATAPVAAEVKTAPSPSVFHCFLPKMSASQAWKFLNKFMIAEDSKGEAASYNNIQYHYKRALERFPKDFILHMGFIVNLLVQNKIDEALTEANRYIADSEVPYRCKVQYIDVCYSIYQHDLKDEAQAQKLKNDNQKILNAQLYNLETSKGLSGEMAARLAVAHDIVKAGEHELGLEWLKKSFENHEPFLQAVKIFKAWVYCEQVSTPNKAAREAAFADLNDLAKTGHVIAETALGRLLIQSKKANDIQRGKQYLAQASQNNLAAKYMFAATHFDASSKEAKEGMVLMKPLAEMGCASAEMCMAIANLKGEHGIVQNVQEGTVWLLAAAQHDSDTALFTIAVVALIWQMQQYGLFDEIHANFITKQITLIRESVTNVTLNVGGPTLELVAPMMANQEILKKFNKKIIEVFGEDPAEKLLERAVTIGSEKSASFLAGIRPVIKPLNLKKSTEAKSEKKAEKMSQSPHALLANGAGIKTGKPVLPLSPNNGQLHPNDEAKIIDLTKKQIVIDKKFDGIITNKPLLLLKIVSHVVYHDIKISNEVKTKLRKSADKILKSDKRGRWDLIVKNLRYGRGEQFYHLLEELNLLETLFPSLSQTSRKQAEIQREWTLNHLREWDQSIRSGDVRVGHPLSPTLVTALLVSKEFPNDKEYQHPHAKNNGAVIFTARLLEDDYQTVCDRYAIPMADSMDKVKPYISRHVWYRHNYMLQRATEIATRTPSL